MDLSPVAAIMTAVMLGATFTIPLGFLVGVSTSARRNRRH